MALMLGVELISTLLGKVLLGYELNRISGKSMLKNKKLSDR